MSDYTEQGFLEIIPLEGQLPAISLTATALPFKGVSFPTEQRIKTTYYPGNPVATQTVIGPVKPSTTMTGRWMDISIGEGGARALILQIEYLCERAIPVEVRWGGRSLPNGQTDPAIVRRGLIKKFDPKYQRAQDAEWSIEFEWRGDALQTKPPSFSANVTNGTYSGFAGLSGMMSDCFFLTTSWLDVTRALIGMATNAMLVLSDAMDAVQNALVDSISVIDGATTMLQQVAELPSDVCDRVRGCCVRVTLACANGRAAFVATCGLWPGIGFFGAPDFIAKGLDFQADARRAKIALFPTDDPLARLDGQTAQFDLIAQWDLVAEQAATVAASLAAQQVPDIIAIIRPPAGTDLRDLALKYYGQVDDWIYIADFNGLASSEVPVTSTGPSDLGNPPLYIPALAQYGNQLLNTWGDV